MQRLTYLTRHRHSITIILLLLGCSGCDPSPDPTAEEEALSGPPRDAVPHYTRHYLFVGERDGEPTVASFEFRAADHGEEITRTTRGWLAHGATWDPFLSLTSTAPQAADVWSVLPRGDLKVAVDHTSEPEAILFARGERRLRLGLGGTLSRWSPSDDARFGVLNAVLTLGDQSVPGTVLEVLHATRRPLSAVAEGSADWLVLSGPGSLRLVVAEAVHRADSDFRSFAWTRLPEVERRWNEAEVRWLEMRPLEDARRDIPVAWSFRIPGSGIEGELTMLGDDVTLGPERGVRRAVEVYYTVRGEVDISGERYPVVGVIRHTQE